MDNLNESISSEAQNHPSCLGDVSCCALLEELQLKLISMGCFAQEHFNKKAYDVTKMNIDEIKHWIKKKKFTALPLTNR